MKKFISLFILLLISMHIFVTAEPEIGVSGVLEIFVQNGAQNGDGSFEKPFGTIEEAKDFIRDLKKNGSYPQKGVEVNIREGKFSMSETLEFTKEDSGTAEAPVVYQAYGNEEVSFIGGAEIDLADFKKVTDTNTLKRIRPEAKDNIYYVDLKNYGLYDYGVIQPTGWGVNQFWELEGTPEMVAVREYTGFVPNTSASSLFINGEARTLARYPNGTEMCKIEEPIDGGTRHDKWMWVNNYTGEYINGSSGEPLMPWEEVQGPTVKGPSDLADRMKGWSEATDPWVYGYWYYGYADLSSPVKSFDAEQGIFTLRLPNIHYGNGNPAHENKGSTAGQPFYMFNLLEEIDVPGEWYLERTDGKLYYYPQENLRGTALLTTMVDAMFNLDGASHIKFRKLIFNGHRSDAIKLEGCDSITFELCELTQIGNQAIVAMMSKNCKYLSCYFENIQAGGISLGSNYDMNLTPANNLIENCWFKNFGMNGSGYTAALSMRGTGDVARHCRIHDCDAAGFFMGGVDSIFEYSEVYDILRHADDMGVCYDYQNQHRLGGVVRHNYIHDISSPNAHESTGIQGIYQDGGSSGMTVHSNIFENFGGRAVMFNGGHYNSAYNNIVINSKTLGTLTGIMYDIVDTSSMETIKAFYKDYVEAGVADNPIYDKYPHSREFLNDNPNEPKYNVIKDNVIVNSGEFYYQGFGSFPKEQALAQNTIEESLKYDDPGFVNINTGDFRLKAESPIYEEIPDFEAPDFEKIGIYTPRLAYKLGENSVSMLINSNIAYHGFEPVYIDNSNRMVVPVIINDRTYLPIRFIGESLGGSVAYDNSTALATINLNGKTLLINSGTGEMSVDGVVLSEYVSILKEGRLLVPVRAFESLGVKVTWYDGGLVVVGDAQDLHDTYLNGKADNSLIDELIRRLD